MDLRSCLLTSRRSVLGRETTQWVVGFGRRLSMGSNASSQELGSIRLRTVSEGGALSSTPTSFLGRDGAVDGVNKRPGSVTTEPDGLGSTTNGIETRPDRSHQFLSPATSTPVNCGNA